MVRKGPKPRPESNRVPFAFQVDEATAERLREYKDFASCESQSEANRQLVILGLRLWEKIESETKARQQNG